jgi:hypothetical protein
VSFDLGDKSSSSSLSSTNFIRFLDFDVTAGDERDECEEFDEDESIKVLLLELADD